MDRHVLALSIFRANLVREKAVQNDKRHNGRKPNANAAVDCSTKAGERNAATEGVISSVEKQPERMRKKGVER